MEGKCLTFPGGSAAGRPTSPRCYTKADSAEGDCRTWNRNLAARTSTRVVGYWDSSVAGLRRAGRVARTRTGNWRLAGCRAMTVSVRDSSSRRSGWVTGNLAVEAGSGPAEKVGVFRAVVGCRMAAGMHLIPIADEL